MTDDDILAISAMGESALLCQAPGEFGGAAQERILGLAEVVAAWPGVVETVPGVNNLLVMFAPGVMAPGAMRDRLRDAWTQARAVRTEPRTVEIPVAYGGEHGPDLAGLAERTGLSPDEVVRLHGAPTYTVLALGSVPGFPYLAGLDRRLAAPRLDVPRLRMPAGSVLIGGEQGGILPVASPTGWHCLGWTPFTLFNPAADPPVTLRAGDRLRFVAAERPA